MPQLVNIFIHILFFYSLHIDSKMNF